jgi:hypothetical protein
MSKLLTAQAIASFDARVKAAYQAMGMLRPYVRLATGIIGSTHRFVRIGKGTATKRVSQTDVVPMNVAYGNTTATLEDWNAPEYTDVFDMPKVNFSERELLATTIAGAIGRREDQLIIDALDASSTALVVDTDIGGADSGLNTAKFRRARRLLNEGSVPRGRGDRVALVSAEGIEQMLGTTEVTSSDFAAVKALVDGEINSWLGFDVVEMDERDEGGLPVAAGVRTNFFYHKDAVGLAVGINFRTEVNYVPQKVSWLANGLFSAGATYIDAAGIVEVETTEEA